MMDLSFPNFRGSQRTTRSAEESSILNDDTLQPLPKTNDGTIQRTKHKIYASLTRISGPSKLPPSPTPHLLSCNEPPTEMELPLILDFISQVEVEADRLAVALASKKTTGVATISLRLTEHKLDRVNKILISHRRILSPIRRLPTEILEEIFAFSIADCESGSMGSKDFHRKLSSIPRSQSQVCKFWREIALSNPWFWNHLPTIYLDRPYARKPHFLSYLTDLLDQRCNNLPMTLHIVLRSKMDVFNSHPALAVLVSHSTRWKTAILDLAWLNEEEILGIKGRIPLLETLVLSFSALDHVPPPVDAFQIAPRLRKVLLVRGDSSISLLPHHQLVHYREDCYTTQCDDYSKFISLHTLEIGEYCSLPEGPVVTLANLVVMRVKTTSLIGQSHPLEGFILPALKELSVSCIAFGPIELNVMPFILSLILRPGRPSLLEKLHVRSGLMEAGALASLLGHLPLITHLSVDFPPVEDIKRLIPTTDVIVPLLQVCTFYSVGLLDDDQASLCRQLALSRCDLEVPDFLATDVHPMRAFYIEFGFCSADSQQRILHGWTENAITHTLRAYRRSLIKHLYKKVRPPDLTSLLAGDYYTRIIHSTLSLTSQIKVTRAEDLYLSGILRVLYHIIDRFPTNTKSWKESFSQNSELILDKWKPLVEASFDDFHWAIRDHCIFYVSRNNPFRKSLHLMTRLVTEQIKESEIPDADRPLAWPLNEWI